MTREEVREGRMRLVNAVITATPGLTITGVAKIVFLSRSQVEQLLATMEDKSSFRFYEDDDGCLYPFHGLRLIGG